MAEPLFYYFGDDEAYFKTLQGEFKKHTKLSAKFERHFSSKEDHIQALFLLIAKHRPKCVFIDFSKETQDYLHLARLVARINLPAKPLVVGLLDYLSPKDVMFESIATGINLTHIKSAEIFDVVYDVGALLSPEAIPAHGFATAEPGNEMWEAGAVAKVGYVHKDGLHLETNLRFAKGDRLILDHAWTKDKLIPSREMFVTNTTTKNLFYHFDFGADLDFVVIDEFIPPEGMTEVDINDRRAEREELIRRQKKKMEAWVEDNLSRSQEKNTKFLVIDKEFRFLLGQKRTDKYPYIIRCAPYLEDIAGDLGRLCPQLIAVALEPDTVKDAQINFDFLEKLVAVVKRDHAESSPYLVVFNTKVPTKDLRQQLAYEHLMATDGELEAEVLIKMGEILDKKLGKAKKPDAEHVYLRKTNAASHAFITLNVKILKISETDLLFTCDRDLPVGTNLCFSKPVPFYVNVRPMKGQGKLPEYLGLIHCLGEQDKKELRKYINSVFFRDHDAELKVQTDEFKKLNEDKLQQKLEAIRIAQEKALAEEEEKRAAEAEKKAEEEAVKARAEADPNGDKGAE
jgi:hypothetical protein